jgi:GNAT superfamily N-acetyltransferase
MTNMNLKQLNNVEIESIYNEHMIKDFPHGELKPLEVIQKLNKKNNYICFGLYKNEELLAYALLATSKLYLLIDYYAVCEQYRNHSIGSEFLSMLKEECKNYNGIIVEVEKVECASTETEKLIRKRRINFYKKNGMRMTNILCKLFDVNYCIMCLCNIELEDSVIYEGLKDIYQEIIPVSLYSKYVELSYV